MKILIAVVNAHGRQTTWAQAVRDTWKSQVTWADVLFFVGRRPGIHDQSLKILPKDTVQLDCDDSYEGLPEKVREIVRWAYNNDYDYMLKCDDDTVLDVRKLLVSGFDKYDYTGRANRPPCPEHAFWVPMGFNYWLSKRAMATLKDAPLPDVGNDDERWAASHLYTAGIVLHNDTRYRLKYGYKVSKRPLRIKRPPRAIPKDDEPNEGSFSWSIFLEGNSGNMIPIGVKLSEFHRVFAEFVPVYEDSHRSSEFKK